MSLKLGLNDLLALPNSKVKIPRLGFGVYQSPPGQCVKSCLAALKAGYRHIDTAQFYANETQVGEAVQQSGLKRSDIFLTTKILGAGGSVQKSYAKCLASVEKLDPGKDGYVDLFLIHAASGGAAKRKEMWLALEQLYEEGRTKSIGVSNFGIAHMEEMKSYAKVWPPHVLQIEVSFSFFVSWDTAVLSDIVASLVSAEKDREILSGQRHRGRGLLPSGPQLQGQRP